MSCLHALVHMIMISNLNFILNGTFHPYQLDQFSSVLLVVACFFFIFIQILIEFPSLLSESVQSFCFIVINIIQCFFFFVFFCSV